MSYHLFPVLNRLAFRQFLHLPWYLYQGDRNWVPPLLAEVAKQLDPRHNPLFQYARRQCWLLKKVDGKAVGRIAAIVNPHHNNHYQDHVGFFGYFECINDPEAAAILLEAAAGWLREQGMTSMRGPVNPSMADECGLLRQGFDTPPVLMMPYNPPYYESLFFRSGLEHIKNLLAFHLTAETLRQNPEIIERIDRIYRAVTDRQQITFRQINLKKLEQEASIVKELFNDYMQDNWGYYPLTDAEVAYIAEGLHSIARPDYIYFAEHLGNPIGVSITLPDYNQVFKRMNGRLFPFGIFPFLYYRKRIDRIRVFLMGIRQAYQRRGIDAAFYYHTIRESLRQGIRNAELSWISEDNQVLINGLEKMGARIYKIYGIYERSIVRPAGSSSVTTGSARQ